MVREVAQGPNNKGLVARILKGQPTGLQKAVSWLMVLSLLIWPLLFFVSIFFFDAPIHSTFDEISRWGMVLTIWLYPIYLFPLMRFCFWLSKRLRATWLFCICPLIPIAVFLVFIEMASSEYAQKKPEGYDASTFERIDQIYSKDINHVYYGYNILEGADPASFHVISEEYSADSQHVWYNTYIIEGANPQTFVAPEKNNSFGFWLAHDDHDYYNGANPLHVADMGTFKLKGNSWAIDSQNVYYLDAQRGKYAVPIGDYRTFRVLGNCYAADAKSVYYQNQIVEGADPETFAVLKGEHRYGQDKNRVYCEAYGSSIKDLNTLRHKNMEDGLYDAFHTDGKTVYNPNLMSMPAGTDFATIHRVERYSDWYADNKQVYYENRLLPDANPQTFKILPSHYVSKDYVSNNNKSTKYSCDGNHVYYRDSLMHGVDVSTFICGYDFVESQPFAFDKKRYYQGRPNPRLEKLRQGKCRVDSE